MTTNCVKAVPKPGTVQVSNAWSYTEVADYLGERPYPERCPEFREHVRRSYVPAVPEDRLFLPVTDVCDVVRFAAVELDDWPDRNLRGVIAHEFAHVFQFASGEIPRVVWEDLDTPIEIDEDMGEVDFAEAEREADAIAERWGFVQDWLDWDEE